MRERPFFVRFFTDGGLFRPEPLVATPASRRVSREKRRRAPPEPGPRGETRASPRSARGGDRRRRACARRDATVSRVAWQRRRAAFAEGLAPGRMRFLELSRKYPENRSIPATVKSGRFDRRSRSIEDSVNAETDEAPFPFDFFPSRQATLAKTER